MQFEEFFKQNFPVVVRVAYGVTRDEHLAEDIAQEVLISAEKRFELPRDAEHAVGWVRVAAVHLGLNAVRAGRRREQRQNTTLPSIGSLDPAEEAVERDQESMVRELLGRLPRHAATVLVLRHSGLTYAEVADSMGVKVGQVGTMLRRAETRFRKEFERAPRR
jgi:RNA polymerase sigma factor (sigma-70 family)